MENKIIDLEIIEDLIESGVSAISLVEIPAIEKNWLAFAREEFVDPSAGESEEDFIPRCIAKLVGDEGYENDQAAAICYSTYREKMDIDNPCWEGYEPYGLNENGAPNCIPVKSKEEKFAETYTDYPQAARNAAQRALDWAEENGWGDCGTPIGKARANQLAKGRPITEETIARMASFARHRQNSDTPYGEGCGKLMWDAWGGDAGVDWASRKLERIRRQELSIDVSALPVYVDEIPKKKMSKQFFASEDQRIVVGPAMIPDMVIPRVDEKTKERYAVKFSAATIAKIAEKFMRELRNGQTNVEHNGANEANSYVKETWIVETEDDKANTKYGLDVPIGTWMVAMRVQDKAVWDQIKEGKLNGFSIEGNFMEKEDYEQYKKDREMYDRVVRILKSI